MQLSDSPHQVLALYGEIDNQVVAARNGTTAEDRAVVRLVETMLPGTTGFGQAGWYRELERFANRLRRKRAGGEPVEPVRFPTFTESIHHLANLPLLPSAEPAKDTTAAHRSSSPAVALRHTDRSTDLDPALAKAAYAAAVLDKISRIRLSDVPLSAPINNIGPALAGWLPTTFDARNDESVRADLDTVEGRRTRSTDLAAELVGRMDQITGRAEYSDIAREVVSAEFADMSLPCFGTLEDSGGLYCSTLYTRHDTEDLSVDDIARIINPLNWPLCSPFFDKMEYCQPRYTTAHWHRIRETIGAELDEYRLETSLIFHFADHRAGGAAPNRPRGVLINYDLDPHRDDDGIVEVDNGYLWVTPRNAGNDPTEPGVTIRSSKQERINGLSPTATSALGCILGWGQAAETMLAGTARDVLIGKLSDQGFHPFPVDTALKNADDDIDHGASGPAAPAPVSLPPNFADTVADTQHLLIDLINRTTAVAGDGADRWARGLGRQDVADLTSAMGANLTEWADLVYDTAERNVINKEDARTQNGIVDG
ncbi:MAG: hypothetical protein K0R68_615 [Mycobacterium sp.]|nr:hypothetical protein [Mycobacterium sp.]